MARRGSLQHEKGVIDFLKELSDDGWKTINLKGMSPDGIAVKDGKIVAVEILTYSDTCKNHNTDNMKKSDYFMFDDVLIKRIKRDKNKDNECRLKDGGTRW